MLACFTILSNTIVGVTSLLLALNPYRRSTVFRVFRLMGLVAITITFVFALIRGAIDRWYPYPYPFADVNSLGYGRVIVNAFWISVLLFAFAMGALDQALPRPGVGARPPAPASS